ncbi:PilN domain-containing protein [Vibrio aquimaris]|uniref:Fimbrial assembly protein (PilN) n=1 Tax=Vibrio aquimaris TaxID=2587862 RepID=A0A5P9CHP0_9VIBR|nr:PilN domain-containing protein [Vibrio aquimaris]QFT25062.1 Fimbrial assembly protein (PilN) [Vibrio aquimaris]
MIHNINLVPWRERHHREQLRRLILGLCLVTALGIFISCELTYYLASQVAIQQLRVLKLNERIQWLEQRKKQVYSLRQDIDTIKANINHLARLDAKRSYPLITMHTLAELIPEDVYFNHISLSGARVDVQGVATTVKGIDTLLTNLSESSQTHSVRMSELRSYQQDARLGYQSFSLQFSLVEDAYD